MPLVRWYRSLYLACVHDALGLMEKMERSKESEELCLKALDIDPFDELLIEFHLKALISQGKYTEALDEYKRMEMMFFDVLGVSFSENLRSMYSKIQHPADEPDIPLDDLLEDWLKDADTPGAYYCDASVFKTFYQIESRSVPRTGRTAFIVRFDTKHEPKMRGGGIVKQLSIAIPNCLRMGDLFTRVSPSQYMLILYSLTYEDCKMLINRILRAVDSKYLPQLIGTTIRHIGPID